MPTFACSSGDTGDEQLHIPKIVITGGPCSGKTTGMALLQTTLKGLGYRVYIAPESATMYFLAGIQFSDLPDPALSAAFQKTVLSGQLNVENSLDRYARATGKKSIILCDRGAMDGKAYMDDGSFDAVLADCGLNESTANAGRYDAVFHLVTAADGATEHYSLENNETRTESADFAKVIDKKTQAAWAGHPKHFIIDNSSSSFEEKMEKLISTMLHCIGQNSGPAASAASADAPTAKISSTGVYHFEVNGVSPDDVASLESVKVFNVEKCILAAEACPGHLVALFGHHGDVWDLERVELHRQYPQSDGGDPSTHLSVYSLLQVRRLTSDSTAPGQGVAAEGCAHPLRIVSSCITETRRIISHNEYNFLRVLFPDPPRLCTRYCFVWKNQVMHLYHSFPSDAVVWELTVFSASGLPSFPDFLSKHVIRQIV